MTCDVIRDACIPLIAISVLFISVIYFDCNVCITFQRITSHLDDPNSSRFSDYDVAEMMAASIREEIRRLHRKKQLHFNPKLAESTSPADTSSDSPGSPTSFSSVFPANTPDKPLFTFRQVNVPDLLALIFFWYRYLISFIYFRWV